jgi:Polysaccharide pyruvyl transferase
VESQAPEDLRGGHHNRIVIHHVFANKSNIGDWLSARAIQTLLGHGPLCEHFCDGPFVAGTLAALREAKTTDLIVIGGGGLFMDYFDEFWQGFRPVAQRVPFAIWGVGCCEMKRQNSRLSAGLMEEIVSLSRLCVVRDDLTRSALPGCVLPPPVACPSISLVTPTPPGFGLLHVDAFDNVGEANYEAMEVFGKEFAAAVGRPFRSINNLIPAASERSLRSVLACYEDSDLILAGRLHGCVIGLAMGRKVLAVSGDHKIESFMRAAGLGEWVLDLCDVRSIPQRLRDLAAQPSPAEFLARTRAEHHHIAAKLRAIFPQAIK